MSNTNIKLSHPVSPEAFHQAVDILVNKPHVLNKRLWGSKIWLRHSYDSSDEEVNWQTHFHNLESVTPEKIKEYVEKVCEIMNLKNCKDSSNTKCIEIILIELLPKNYVDTVSYQLVILKRNEYKVIFYNITPSKEVQNTIPSFTYTLSIIENDLVLHAHCEDSDNKSFTWLKNTLLPQFMKWATETVSNKGNNQICTESLSLVSNKRYFEKYNELKLKYGKEMVKIWPECTDPNKFVYEDVAIATYLLLLWEERCPNSQKQKFVDLGCGNGLLVYILCKEGHEGLGIDIRKRQIWDIYPPEVKLEVKTITPSESNLFPDADWIIGNHSDELTPWIPVIAARSSYKCNFFLLPCCAFNFDGTKYQRVNSKKSQYIEYLEHVKNISEECGFNTDLDRLKIPSTKRICLVSRGRMYSPENSKEYTYRIQELTGEDEVVKGNNDTWLKDFKPRESVEKVRNCTQLDKNLIGSIVKIVADCLLEECCKDDEQWSLGKSVEINELVAKIPKEKLTQLKSECGGLQTLLKNNHNIFLVSGGKVLLRYPQTIDQVKASQLKKNKSTNTRLQVKPCWFYDNHPQGCPLSSINCSYLHEIRLNDK